MSDEDCNGARRSGCFGRRAVAEGPVQGWSFRVAQARGLIERPIIRNGASLFGSTVLTSAFGFVFWIIAARLLTTTAVGAASGLVSAAQFLASCSIFGLGTLAIGELAGGSVGARRFLASGTIVIIMLSVIAGAGTALSLHVWSSGLRRGVDGIHGVIIFIVLVVAMAVALFTDDSSVGLLRGGIQLRRNFIFAASKLLLLPVAVVAWRSHSGDQVLGAWLGGLLLSLLFAAFGLRAATCCGTWRPDLRALYRRRQLIYHHHWLNISVIAPSLLMPVIVACIAGARQNAGFYAASLFVSFATSVPSQLSTVLFALKPGDDDALRHEIRGTFLISLMAATGAALGFGLLAVPLLEVFKHEYTSAAMALRLLGLTVLPVTVKTHYIAIARVRGRMRSAAVRASLGALLEIAAAIGGAYWDGATGVAAGLLLALGIEMLMFGPTVISTVSARSREEGSVGAELAGEP